jgi:ribonuclease HI
VVFAADLWNLALDSTASGHDWPMGPGTPPYFLAQLVWGSVFLEYLSRFFLIPSRLNNTTTPNAISEAYERHLRKPQNASFPNQYLQEQGGETTASLSSAIYMADPSSSNKEQALVIVVSVGLPCKFGEKGEGKCVRVGREDEGTSSNRPELGGVVLALQSAALNEDALLLCDNKAVLRVIRKWVGQGGKATLATAPDADILREIICLLTQRVRAGRATFLIKVKSHRGEPINERADTLAEEGRTISDDDKRWDDRTDRMTFEVQKGDTTVRSVWTNSVRNAFRKQAGWAKLQKVRATAATHWTARVWYRHNQRWLQASKEGAEASKSGSFKDERTWGRKCFEDLDQRRMGRPATSTWSTDFLLREGTSREEIGKWLKNKSIPWQRRRRLLQVVTGTFPCGQQLVKYGYKEKAECILCKKAYEENGGS